MAVSESAAVIRSLNADFVRRGIVASGDGAAGSGGSNAVDPKIRQLVETLKGACKASGMRDLPEITSAIQIWKERSLHHTLQTLDQVDKDAGPKGLTTGHERHIQAIELHEKAGREVKESILRVVDGIVISMNREIDGFMVNLGAMINQMVKPELEDELERERRITERLIAERQKLVQAQTALTEANTQLSQRVQALEDAPDGGGDAILCRKLRQQVTQLTQKQREMDAKMLQMENDYAKWRYEMAQMQTEMEVLHKTLAMTRAMHDKETKQLVELLQAKAETFDQVRHATATAMSSNSGGSINQQGLTIHDVQSGRNICYQSPVKVNSVKGSRPLLATLRPPVSPSKTSRPPSGIPASPNRKRMVAASCTSNNNSPGEILSPLLLETSAQQQPSPSFVASQTGRVHRPLSS